MSRGRPFQCGNTSGRGRPKGSRNKATLEREALLDEYGPALTRKCVSEALKGNNSAMRLCMERLLPPARQQALGFKLPPIRNAADLLRASAAILKAVAEGNLSAQDGEPLMRMLETHQKLLDSHQLPDRIAALEQLGSAQPALEEVAGLENVTAPAEEEKHAE